MLKLNSAAYLVNHYLATAAAIVIVALNIKRKTLG